MKKYRGNRDYSKGARLVQLEGRKNIHAEAPRNILEGRARLVLAEREDDGRIRVMGEIYDCDLSNPLANPYCVSTVTQEQWDRFVRKANEIGVKLEAERIRL